jgi:hypothetical protein
VRTDPAEILEAAADLYESEQIEWCKGAFFNDGTNVGGIVSACAWGALILATTEDEKVAMSFADPCMHDPGPPRDVIDNILAARSVVEDKIAQSIVSFNDYRLGTTKQDVIDLFRETAKDLRNQR